MKTLNSAENFGITYTHIYRAMPVFYFQFKIIQRSCQFILIGKIRPKTWSSV